METSKPVNRNQLLLLRVNVTVNQLTKINCSPLVSCFVAPEKYKTSRVAKSGRFIQHLRAWRTDISHISLLSNCPQLHFDNHLEELITGINFLFSD